MAGGSSSSSKSTPVDMTPQAFRNLQSPFANVVASLLGYQPQGNSGTTSVVGASGASGGQTPQTPQGAIPAPGGTINGGGDTGPIPVPGTPAPTGTPGAGVPPTYSKSGTGFNNNQIVNYGGGPGAGGSVLSGIPSYGGQTTAGITGNEQSILDALMGTIGAQGNNSGTAALNGILTGTGNQVSAGPVTGGVVDPNAVTSSFDAQGNNPLLQAYITAAQRATMDNLAHTLVTNGSQFTANGQFIQPTGSSAFDRAQALATQSAANAASDIASNIGFQGYQTDQTLNQLTGSQNASNILAALQGNQNTGLTASQSNASNELNASNANAQNAINAATAQGNLSSTEVQSLVQNLQAQALPRLIEQYGLDQGLQMFNNQVNDLMTLLQTGAGVTSPVVANESKSSSNTKPNLL